MYKQCPPDAKGNVATTVFKLNDDVVLMCIPFDPANTDYQQYLKFLEEGGQPLPAEENE